MNPANQPERPATAKLSGRWVAFILAVVFGSLTLWSLCAGFAYLSLQQQPTALGPANLVIGKLAGRPDPNDWWTSRVLSQVYTVALDTVAADPQVIEHLGESIETDLEAEDLFRRQRAGPLNTADETIAFDITGPKGSATVTVISAGGQLGDMNQALQIREITVTASDGTTIDVPPPADQSFSPR